MTLAQALAREFDAAGAANVGVGREIRRRRYLAAPSGRQNVSALARRRFRCGGGFFRLGGARGLGGLATGLGGLPWRWLLGRLDRPPVPFAAGGLLDVEIGSDDRVRAIGQASLGQRFVSVLLEAAAQDRGKRRSLDGRGNKPEMGRSDCASRRRRYVQMEGLPARGARSPKDDDAPRCRVHSPLPHFTSCRAASAAFATTACWPAAPARITSPGCASCSRRPSSPIQTRLPMTPATPIRPTLIHAHAAAAVCSSSRRSDAQAPRPAG